MLFWKFRERNSGRWPSGWSDLEETAEHNQAYAKSLYFTHPDTGLQLPWLVFDPTNLPAVVDNERIIAAAPSVGGHVEDGPSQRLVMFESGRAIWISNEKFLSGIVPDRVNTN